MRKKAAVLGLVVLAACGGPADVESEVDPAQTTPTSEAEPATPTSEAEPALRCVTAESGNEFCDDPNDFPNASNYEQAREICGLFGVKEVAKEYGTEANPVDAAEGYAEGWRGSSRQATFEGCLDGFSD